MVEISVPEPERILESQGGAPESEPCLVSQLEEQDEHVIFWVLLFRTTPQAYTFMLPNLGSLRKERKPEHSSDASIFEVEEEDRTHVSLGSVILKYCAEP